MSKMRFYALQELANRRPLEVTTPSNKLSDYYGSHVFDRKKMQEYLPREAYKAVTDAIEKGTPISREIADLIANGMKSWAKSLNVTHYTHWFQPLTDGTADRTAHLRELIRAKQQKAEDHDDCQLTFSNTKHTYLQGSM